MRAILFFACATTSDFPPDARRHCAQESNTPPPTPTRNACAPAYTLPRPTRIRRPSSVCAAAAGDDTKTRLAFGHGPLPSISASLARSWTHARAPDPARDAHIQPPGSSKFNAIFRTRAIRIPMSPSPWPFICTAVLGDLLGILYGAQRFTYRQLRGKAKDASHLGTRRSCTAELEMKESMDE